MIEGEMILEFQEIVKDYMELRERIQRFHDAQQVIQLCGFHNYLQLAKGINAIAEIREASICGTAVHVNGVIPHNGFPIVQVENIR